MALTDGLQAYWKFDESSGDAADSVNSNTATNVNTTSYASAKINNGASLASASSNHFTVSDAVSMRVDDGWSVAYWIKPATVPAGGGVMYVFNQRSGENGWGAGLAESGGSVYHSVWTGSGAFGNQLTTATVSASTWYHAVIYFNGASTKIYIDGGSAETLSNAAITNPNTTTYIGRKATGASDYYNGLLDEVGIWNRELTSGEVTSLYNGGAGLAYPFSGGGGGIERDSRSLLLLGVG